MCEVECFDVSQGSSHFCVISLRLGPCVDGAGSILVIERGPELSRLLAAT